jgi:hypothetical protein
MSRMKSAAPRYAVVFIALAMLAIGAMMSWVTLRYFMTLYSHHGAPAEQSSSAGQPATTADIANATLQQDVLSDFARAAQQAKSGETTNAEAQVDQAASEMENARVESQSTSVDFFSRATVALDAIVMARPSGSQDTAESMAAGHLFDHVTPARIELAAMRSAEEPMPPGSTLAAAAQAQAASAAAAQANDSPGAAGTASSRPVAAPQTPKLPLGHVVINAPRELAANDLLDPAALGGNFLDASMMPDEVEVLLPPEARQFSDNVRVENLTIASASQTLDGIHWRNVTFIGTRLRYEDGHLDLQNVRFVHCTFGFPSDERGASVANAIALGKTSITIQ